MQQNGDHHTCMSLLAGQVPQEQKTTMSVIPFQLTWVLSRYRNTLKSSRTVGWVSGPTWGHPGHLSRWSSPVASAWKETERDHYRYPNSKQQAYTVEQFSWVCQQGQKQCYSSSICKYRHASSRLCNFDVLILILFCSQNQQMRIVQDERSFSHSKKSSVGLTVWFGLAVVTLSTTS